MQSHFRPLAPAAFGVAALLIVIPLLDSILAIWPLRPGEVNWRYGAVGTLSRALMTPLLGLFLILTAAVVLEYRRTTRIFAGISLFAATLMLAAVVMFGLDALQARVNVRPEVLRAFDSATIAAGVKYGFGALLAILLGVGGWKAADRLGRSTRGRAHSGRPEASAEDRGVLLGTTTSRGESDSSP